METQKTITVTVPASEPQTTTKEINVPSYWKHEPSHKFWLEYLLILSPTVTVKLTKIHNGNWIASNTDIPTDFKWSDAVEISETDAKKVFKEMQKVHNDLVFGDQQEQFDQAIQSYTEQNFVTDKPIIERKHTEFE